MSGGVDETAKWFSSTSNWDGDVPALALSGCEC
jgi:hypothetical protein